MGWMSGWHTRKDLIKHLVEDNGTDHWSVEKHCCVGNNLWVVARITKDGKVERHICLFLMQRFAAGEWAYKDVDESMGPYEVNCPLSYLDQVSEPYNENSREWREKVRAYHARRNRKIEPGMRLGPDGKFRIVRNLGRSGWMVEEVSNQAFWRLPKAHAARLDIYTGE